MKKGYIDANIFIQAIIRQDNSCINVLRKIIQKEIFGVTSVLSWDELVFIVNKFVNRDISIIEGRKFLQFPNLKFIEVKAKIIQDSQKLIEKYKIKPRDAIHAATALNLGINEIISYDSDFDKISEINRIDPKKL